MVPDYILPTLNFLNPAGDTIRLFSPLFGEFHLCMFSNLPTGGLKSINYPPIAGALAKNSPKNFSGATGFVIVPERLLAPWLSRWPSCCPGRPCGSRRGSLNGVSLLHLSTFEPQELAAHEIIHEVSAILRYSFGASW